MKVRLLKDYVVKADFTIPAKTIIDVSDKKAKSLIEAGYASKDIKPEAPKISDETK